MLGNFTKIIKKVKQNFIRVAKDKYYSGRIKEAGNDTRLLWSIMNEVIHRKQTRHRMPSRFIVGGKSIRDKKNISMAFNRSFAAIREQMADSLPDILGYDTYLKDKGSLNGFMFMPYTVAETKRIIRKQKPKLSCGVDTINNKIVKTCFQELALPMTYIIKKSMQEGVVPVNYKIARISPLYKKVLLMNVATTDQSVFYHLFPKS